MQVANEQSLTGGFTPRHVDTTPHPTYLYRKDSDDPEAVIIAKAQPRSLKPPLPPLILHIRANDGGRSRARSPSGCFCLRRAAIFSLSDRNQTNFTIRRCICYKHSLNFLLFLELSVFNPLTDEWVDSGALPSTAVPVPSTPQVQRPYRPK